jgi:hypothetical protein
MALSLAADSNHVITIKKEQLGEVALFKSIFQPVYNINNFLVSKIIPLKKSLL